MKHDARKEYFGHLVAELTAIIKHATEARDKAKPFASARIGDYFTDGRTMYDIDNLIRRVVNCALCAQSNTAHIRMVDWHHHNELSWKEED